MWLDHCPIHSCQVVPLPVLLSQEQYSIRGTVGVQAPYVCQSDHS